MREKQTIAALEKEIQHYESLLLTPNLSMDFWSDTIHKYHAAFIKLYQFKGEQPQVMHYKPEHII